MARPASVPRSRLRSCQRTRGRKLPPRSPLQHRRSEFRPGDGNLGDPAAELQRPDSDLMAVCVCTVSPLGHRVAPHGSTIVGVQSSLRLRRRRATLDHVPGRGVLLPGMQQSAPADLLRQRGQCGQQRRRPGACLWRPSGPLSRDSRQPLPGGRGLHRGRRHGRRVLELLGRLRVQRHHRATARRVEHVLFEPLVTA